MRDLTRAGFDSNSPLRNYVKLSERIDVLEQRFRRLEQLALDTAVRLNTGKSADNGR
jgi:hypothetical protein